MALKGTRREKLLVFIYIAALLAVICVLCFIPPRDLISRLFWGVPPPRMVAEKEDLLILKDLWGGQPPEAVILKEVRVSYGGGQGVPRRMYKIQMREADFAKLQKQRWFIEAQEQEAPLENVEEERDELRKFLYSSNMPEDAKILQFAVKSMKTGEDREPISDGHFAVVHTEEGNVEIYIKMRVDYSPSSK